MASNRNVASDVRPIGTRALPATEDRFMDLRRFFEAVTLRCQSGHPHVPRKELMFAGTAMHLATAGTLLYYPLTGSMPGLTELTIFGVSYSIRMFGVIAGHHRYFSHRSFQTTRSFQCILALLGASSFQKGPIWWASHHLEHHVHSDTPQDSHSPVSGSLVWAHAGWFWASEENNEWPDRLRKPVRHWLKYPELVAIDRHDKIPPIMLLTACYAMGDISGLLWGFVLPTVGIWHSMFSLNSICHSASFGSRRFDTPDHSRNVWWFFPLLGGQWHNNHHKFHWSAREGLKSWELDPVYYGLLGLEKLGVVWKLRVPSERQIAKLEINT